MIVHALVVLTLAAAAYAVYKHLTVAEIKAELVKIEGEIVNGTLAAEVKATIQTLVARIKALI